MLYVSSSVGNICNRNNVLTPEYQDRTMLIVRERLKSKILSFELFELKTPVILTFSEYHMDILNAWGDMFNCTIRIYVNILYIINQRLDIIKLNANGLIYVEEDIQFLQQFIILLNIIELNWSELLIPWISDVTVESISGIAIYLYNKILRLLGNSRELIKQLITDKLYSIPSQVEQIYFCDEIKKINIIVENLAAHLEKCEACAKCL